MGSFVKVPHTEPLFREKGDFPLRPYTSDFSHRSSPRTSGPPLRPQCPPTSRPPVWKDTLRTPTPPHANKNLYDRTERGERVGMGNGRRDQCLPLFPYTMEGQLSSSWKLSRPDFGDSVHTGDDGPGTKRREDPSPPPPESCPDYSMSTPEDPDGRRTGVLGSSI